MTDQTTDPMTGLTTDEQQDFDSLLALATTSSLGELPEGVRVALMRARLDGEEVAIVTVVSEAEGDNDFTVAPVAVLMNDSIFARIEQP